MIKLLYHSHLIKRLFFLSIKGFIFLSIELNFVLLHLACRFFLLLHDSNDSCGVTNHLVL